MKQLPAQDGAGRNWIVYDEDIAWPHLHALFRKGVTEAVLPISTLLTGVLPTSPEGPDLSGLPLEAVDSPEVKAVVRRQIRLNDCVAWLRQNEVLIGDH